MTNDIDAMLGLGPSHSLNCPRHLFGWNHILGAATDHRCPHSQGNFGVQTTIYEILLTSKHLSKASSNYEEPIHTNPNVNKIS